MKSTKCRLQSPELWPPLPAPPQHRSSVDDTGSSLPSHRFVNRSVVPKSRRTIRLLASSGDSLHSIAFVMSLPGLLGASPTVLVTAVCPAKLSTDQNLLSTVSVNRTGVRPRRSESPHDDGEDQLRKQVIVPRPIRLSRGDGQRSVHKHTSCSPWAGVDLVT